MRRGGVVACKHVVLGVLGGRRVGTLAVMTLWVAVFCSCDHSLVG